MLGKYSKDWIEFGHQGIWIIMMILVKKVFYLDRKAQLVTMYCTSLHCGPV